MSEPKSEEWVRMSIEAGDVGDPEPFAAVRRRYTSPIADAEAYGVEWVSLVEALVDLHPVRFGLIETCAHALSYALSLRSAVPDEEPLRAAVGAYLKELQEANE